MGISLPAIIGNGMVLEQRARIWGSCDDASSVQITWQEKTYEVPVENNRWEIFLESPCYGGPYLLSIGEITLVDLFIGRVFCMSGQSNMELPINRVRSLFDQELQSVDDPLIRRFYVEKNTCFTGEQPLATGNWEPLSGDCVDDMSAVSYFMAKRLRQLWGDEIPIGLIECAVGGSKIESWMPKSLLQQDAYQMALLNLCCEGEGDYVERTTKRDEQIAAAWKEQLDRCDIGIKDGVYDQTAWQSRRFQTRRLTADWANDIGYFHGSVWFFKTITLTAEQLSHPQDAVIHLGAFVDQDECYVNGCKIGSTHYQYPPRVYTVPHELLCEGENLIAVRAINERGQGGFVKGKEYSFKLNEVTINLDCEWDYHLGAEMPALPPATFFIQYPVGLYNAMLAPILPYTIGAFAWYQGESNTESPRSYGALLRSFLTELRRSQGDAMPFLVVALPHFDAGVLCGGWELLVQQQRSILTQPHTAVILTDDVGEDNDLHPRNKKAVGERLAVAACILLEGTALSNDHVLIATEQPHQ